MAKNNVASMKQTNKSARLSTAQWVDLLVFALLVVGVFAVTLWLFYKQTTGNPQSYHSDMKAYIQEMTGEGSIYSFPYPIFFKFSAFLHLFFGAEFSVALATAIMNTGAIILTKLSLDRLVRRETPRVLISVAAVGLFFISMLYTPGGLYLPGIKFKYLGVFTANPFHNATYMAARPFAILAFLWFAKLMPVYEKGVRWFGQPDDGTGKVSVSDYLWFSLCLLLATMTKPSFTIVLVGAAGLIMLYRMIRSKFSNFVPTILLGLTFIPTFIDLLYQFKGVFVPEEGVEGGMGFCFGDIWALYCGNIPLAICLAIGFPVLVLIVNFGKLKTDSIYRFSWQIYLMSFAMAFLLYEKGFRAPDFNFSWGYMYGIFFAHFGALIILLQESGRVIFARDYSKKQWVLFVLQWLAYLAHLVCGLFYFWGFLQGKMYY